MCTLKRSFFDFLSSSLKRKRYYNYINKSENCFKSENKTENYSESFSNATIYFHF